jgi:hypothetical protein
LAGHRKTLGKPLRGDARISRRRKLMEGRLAEAPTASRRVAAACDYFRACAATVHPSVVEAVADVLVPQIVDTADQMIGLGKEVPA